MNSTIGRALALAAAMLVLWPRLTRAASAPDAPEIHAVRVTAPITIDGALDDEGWKQAARIDTWFETNPGDNVPPKVKNVGYLAYDDHFFYAGFEFTDPDPAKIRAPLGDRDAVPSSTDYGGVILDTRNDGKTGLLFLANPRGIQYDAISDDSSGNEDSSPDFFWSAAGKITPTGWTLEIRIPFTSLRYGKTDPQTWGVMLYRNYPREFRYQMLTTRLPRGGNCFICRSNPLTGLAGLPSGNHLVLAPYASGTRQSMPSGDLGSPLVTKPLSGDLGLDVKWTPSAAMALDATVNPDFSQIESDVAQIAANERFALFFPEKRPFFLEGSELFSTPIPAVYTRTITAPSFGLRTTGRLGHTAYTALLVEDKGGGSVILPGPEGSGLADQEFHSWVGIGRVRRDFGRSFVSALVTDREVRGGGYNRVFGPDGQWRPTANDTVTGQFLLSRTRTPDRPSEAAEWDGRGLGAHAAEVWWSHSTRHVDWFTDYRDFGKDFRADDGFVPQVGYRETSFDGGYTIHPEGFLRRLRTFLTLDRSTDRDGGLLNQEVSPGFGFDARFNSFVRLRYAFDRVRAQDTVLPRARFVYVMTMSPSRVVNSISLDGFVGQEIDFDNVRRGHGANVNLSMSLRPSDHLELRIDESRRFLDVDAAGRTGARLFTARVDRLRATYTFTARSFLRLIGQYVETRRDPSLYLSSVGPRSAGFTASALLAYKLNWQTVLFLGYGDSHTLTDADRLEPEERQFFVKISYAFQR